MNKVAKVKITLPVALKRRIERVGKKLNVPTASAIRIALVEFSEKHGA